jgi:hypothetical protein
MLKLFVGVIAACIPTLRVPAERVLPRMGFKLSGVLVTAQLPRIWRVSSGAGSILQMGAVAASGRLSGDDAVASSDPEELPAGVGRVSGKRWVIRRRRDRCEILHLGGFFSAAFERPEHFVANLMKDYDSHSLSRNLMLGIVFISRQQFL